MYRHIFWLVVAGLLSCAGAVVAQNADTVDGFHAYGTPHANALLALDGSGHLPTSVIADNSIPGRKLAYGAVTAGRLRDGAVTTGKLANRAVTTGKLAYGAVTAGRLGNNSVTTEKITDGQVMAADLAAAAVTRTKIANGAVTTGKIADATIQGGDVSTPFTLSGSNSSRGVIEATNSADGLAGPFPAGVYGYASGASGETHGVSGRADSSSGYAVYGEHSENGTYGHLGGSWIGAKGRSEAPDGIGVYGECNNGTLAVGVWGESSTGYAARFAGKVDVTGNLDVNGDFNVTGSKNFKIDHPLDPENMYLLHSCVESAERLNIYSGNLVLDARGEAWVELPDWFEAVNCDFRYQLTPIGVPGPNLYVAQKIEDGWFRIAGGAPGMEVCWQVTGTRQDPYALAHPFEVEVEKREKERGSYLHPELYGMPETMGVNWATKPEAMMEVHQGR